MHWSLSSATDSRSVVFGKLPEEGPSKVCDVEWTLNGGHYYRVVVTVPHSYLLGWLFHRGDKGKKTRVAHSSPPRAPRARATWASVGLLEQLSATL